MGDKLFESESTGVDGVDGIVESRNKTRGDNESVSSLKGVSTPIKSEKSESKGKEVDGQTSSSVVSDSTMTTNLSSSTTTTPNNTKPDFPATSNPSDDDPTTRTTFSSSPSPSPLTAKSTIQPQRKVHFSTSNLTVPYPVNSPLSLLQLAESHGLSPDYGCRSGACATCETKLLAGKVDGPEGDMEDGILICSSFPVFDGDDDGYEKEVKPDTKKGGWCFGYGYLVGRKGREWLGRGVERGTVVLEL